MSALGLMTMSAFEKHVKAKHKHIMKLLCTELGMAEYSVPPEELVKAFYVRTKVQISNRCANEIQQYYRHVRPYKRKE